MVTGSALRAPAERQLAPAPPIAPVAQPDVRPGPLRRPRTWLVVVAVLHAVSPLVLLGAHWWFGIDESVYLSQLNAHVPAGFFSAPRARGTTFVAAPVTLLTNSVAAVRVWLAALSGLALWAGFRPWLRLRPGWVVPLAALLLSTVWSVIYYGFEAMPNEWVAFATVAACGYLLLFLRDGRRRDLVWVALAVAVVGLFRPSDAAYAAVALGLSALVVRVAGRRRLAAVAAIVVGFLIGAADWVIEAETSYGGLMNRIHVAQAEQGGGGLQFAGGAQARALAGPLLCRGGCHASAGLIYQLWWVGLAALLVIAVVCRGRGGGRVDMVPLFVGLVVAMQYIVGIGYAAPRFLIPAYAMLSLPAAAGMLHVVGWMRARRTRHVVVAALALGLIAQAAVQVRVISSHLGPSMRAANTALLARADVLKGDGVRTGCVMLGAPSGGEDLAYAATCADASSSPASVVRDVGEGKQIVWFRPARPSASYGARWRRIALPRVQHWGSPAVYVSDGTVRTS